MQQGQTYLAAVTQTPKFGDMMHKLKFHKEGKIKKKAAGRWKSNISHFHLEKLQLEVSVGPNTAEPISFLLRLQ